MAVPKIENRHLDRSLRAVDRMMGQFMDSSKTGRWMTAEKCLGGLMKLSVSSNKKVCKAAFSGLMDFCIPELGNLGKKDANGAILALEFIKGNCDHPKVKTLCNEMHDMLTATTVTANANKAVG